MSAIGYENLSSFAGVSSGGGTPDPIPNSEVKPASGDGIAGVTLWESSTMPALFLNPIGENRLGFFMSKICIEIFIQRLFVGGFFFL